MNTIQVVGLTYRILWLAMVVTVSLIIGTKHSYLVLIPAFLYCASVFYYCERLLECPEGDRVSGDWHSFSAVMSWTTSISFVLSLAYQIYGNS